MRAAAGWKARADYTRFLYLQYAARRPVEEWLAKNAPADLYPPAQCGLIAADLKDLGETPPRALREFTLVQHTNSPSAMRTGVLGVAWVLAGSSLGNRAILKEVRRTARDHGETDWPAAFLGDDAMLAFWKGLRAQIECPADMDSVEVASLAASAVFDHFIDHAVRNADHASAVAGGVRATVTECEPG